MVWYNPKTWFKTPSTPSNDLTATVTSPTLYEQTPSIEGKTSTTQTLYEQTPSIEGKTSMNSKVSSPGGSGNITPTLYEQTPSIEGKTEVRTFTKGNIITPSVASTPSFSLTTPPPRYEEKPTSALKKFGRNINPFGKENTYGLIGTYGLSYYAKKTFYDPFEYVGKPDSQKDTKIGTNLNPAWRGTKIDDNFVPDVYKDTSDMTKYEYSQFREQQEYGKQGLIYTGEPSSLIPLKSEEKIIRDVKPQYQKELDSKVTERTNYYQQQIDTGAISYDEANTNLNKEIAQFETDINTRFQSDLSSKINSKYINYAGIQSSTALKQQIFTPPSRTIITNIGRGIETSAVIGASYFGGSGLTLATSGYLGYRSAYKFQKYNSQWVGLSSGQKVGATVDVGLTSIATITTANLGYQKFYNEWRADIFTETSTTKGKLLGRVETQTLDDGSTLTKYGIQRNYNVNTLKQTSIVKTTPTADNRIGFLDKSTTRIKYYDPQYLEYRTTPPFQTSTTGYLQFKETAVLSSKTQAGQIMTAGRGSGVYSSSQTIKTFSFVSASKDQGQFSYVLTGRNPNVKYVSAEGARTSSTLDTEGFIFKIQDGGSSNIINIGRSSSTKTTLDYGFIAPSPSSQVAKDLIKASPISAQETITSQSIQSIKFKSDSKQYQNLETKTVPIFATKSSLFERTQQRDIVLSSQQTPFSPLRTRLASGVVLASFSSTALVTSQESSRIPTLEALGASTRTNILNPPTTPKLTTGTNIGFGVYIPSLSRLNNNVNANIIKGGKRNVAYSPSFTALIFKQTGTYKQTSLSKTGLDYRPINKKWKLTTPKLNLLKLR